MFAIGTFYIDPRVPPLDFDTKASKTQKKTPPHASFRTGGGAISLDLGTAGDVNDVPKALVLVSSRTGNITINLVSAMKDWRSPITHLHFSYPHHAPNLG